MARRLDAVGKLPVDVWAHILAVRAAVVIQAYFRAFKVRHGPLKYIRKYVSKRDWVDTCYLGC